VQSPSDFDGKVRNLGPRVFKFDSPLHEDHRSNILTTADGPRHRCNLGGGSASISGTSVYRGPKRGRRVVSARAIERERKRERESVCERGRERGRENERASERGRERARLGQKP
jgi:hypothetical protein